MLSSKVDASSGLSTGVSKKKVGNMFERPHICESSEPLQSEIDNAETTSLTDMQAIKRRAEPASRSMPTTSRRADRQIAPWASRLCEFHRGAHARALLDDEPERRILAGLCSFVSAIRKRTLLRR